MITIDFRRVEVADGFRILDMGCGSGRHVGAFYERCRARVVGADLNPADLRAAAERLNLHDGFGTHKGGSWMLLAANITRLPFPDNSFDLVLCSEVLEHIPADDAAMAELLRVLKFGCQLVVSVPRWWPEQLCWQLSKAYRSTTGGHVRIYRKKALIQKICATGARYRGAHHAHSLHAPYWWLKCLVGIDNEAPLIIRLYKRLLTWDILQHPPLTRCLEKLLNPLLGKSLVLYFRKEGGI
ncbi:MAG: class I SAM-dependent methyltransferase [Desulfosarcinaceae bacterium]|nr:class I SAM-dependent methyltransferase [Desulfosarcinaceae bacterium]